jgi:septal ring factor EnvC (AmiA/AmiB activator)
MSDRSAPVADAVVPFAPKTHASGDPLDKAAQTILGLLNRAADTAETNYRQAVETTHKLSAQLRAAEDRMRELEAKIRHYQDRADRAERWLYQISVEIERKFFGRGGNQASQPSPPQAVSRN